MYRLKKIFVLTMSLSVVINCGGGGEGLTPDPEVRDYSEFLQPLPSSAVYPLNNPNSKVKEQLGEFLFWDPILSGDQNVACASCNHPDFAWADGRDFSIGVDGIRLGPNRIGTEVTPIHSPTIMNVAFTGLRNSTNVNNFISGGYFWDLRANTLEEQALEPIQNPKEMLGHNIPEDKALDEVLARLNSIPKYVELFRLAFGQDKINKEQLAMALATFQRKMISPNSRFEQFLLGDVIALSQQEIIGLNKFLDAGCADCHAGPMLSDNLINDEALIVGSEPVRTSSLRNIELTAPYMHDGSIISLREAVTIYEDREDLGTAIGEGDIDDVTAFLRSLTSTEFDKGIPSSVPSCLKVGGS